MAKIVEAHFESDLSSPAEVLVSERFGLPDVAIAATEDQILGVVAVAKQFSKLVLLRLVHPQHLDRDVRKGEIPPSSLFRLFESQSCSGLFKGPLNTDGPIVEVQI